MPMFEEFQQAAKTIFEAAQRRGALIRNPGTDRLRALALQEPEVRQTELRQPLRRVGTDVAGGQEAPRTTSTRSSATTSANCWSRPSTVLADKRV